MKKQNYAFVIILKLTETSKYLWIQIVIYKSHKAPASKLNIKTKN